MEKPHQIEVTHESHYAAIRNPEQSQAIALAVGRKTLVKQADLGYPKKEMFCLFGDCRVSFLRASREANVRHQKSSKTALLGKDNQKEGVC
jgi:hypothetical protein